MRDSLVRPLLAAAALAGLAAPAPALPAEREPAPTWTVLEPVKFTSSGGTTLTKQPDGSLLASGAHPSPDTYTVVAHTKLTGITAVRLEMLPDASLGGRGPGRAFHGNFVLNEFRLTAAPLKQPGKAAVVPFVKATADYSQPQWDVTFAIDGNPNNGWAVDPHYGKKHGAVFEAKAPFGFEGGTVLTFALDQSSGVGQHGVGRFRLSVTTHRPPVPLELLELTPRDLEAAWADLAAADAGRAGLAVESLALSRQALGFLKSRLRAEPVKGDPKRVAQLVEDLGHDRFAARERATAELEKLGPVAAPALARAQTESPSEEARRRAGKLLEKVRSSPSLLRAQRGVEVLVRLGSAEARRLLEGLAGGPEETWLTQEARAGVRRLGK